VNAVADELNVGVILVGRPVALEIIEEVRPVGQQPVRLEMLTSKCRSGVTVT